MGLKLLSIAVVLAVLAGNAVAQTPPPAVPPPTDLELEQSRSKMLEGQLGYFINYLRRLENELAAYHGQAAANLTNPKATADWWAAYAAVPPQAAK